MWALVVVNPDTIPTVYFFETEEAALQGTRDWYAKMLYWRHDTDKDLSYFPRPEDATLEEINAWWSEDDPDWWLELVKMENGVGDTLTEEEREELEFQFIEADKSIE